MIVLSTESFPGAVGANSRRDVIDNRITLVSDSEVKASHGRGPLQGVMRMSTATLTENISSQLSGPELPEFTFSKTRWSTSRQDDVGKTAEFWEDNPTAVRIFEDPKFENHPLLMMRKDAFERLYAVVEQYSKGQREIHLDFSILSQQTIALEKFIESSPEGSSFNQGVRHLVHAICECIGRIRGTMVVRKMPKPVLPPSLSAEELAELQAEEDE